MKPDRRPPSPIVRALTLTLLWTACVATAAVVAVTQNASRTARKHTDTFEPPRFTTAEAWQRRASWLREHILVSAGLLPMPARTPLSPVVFGEVTHPDYTVSKVYFESLPGFFVTGNLYRPIGNGPFPAILSPHGHWPYGRLENTATVSGPGRAIGLARLGFVVFTWDMVGYDDSRQIPHTFGGRTQSVWGLSLSGLQLWNAIRSLDFVETLPYVKRDAIGATGESGGGTQTFLLAAVDDRIKVAAPVNMISLHMQGGCLCENPPSLRLETTNVEIAATIAPRPLLMVSATGDWTANTLEAEYPAVRSIYALLGAADRVKAVRMEAEHNYNKDSREAMYAWMARWLQGAPDDATRREENFTADSPADLLVFHQRPLPPDAVDADGLTTEWIAAAKRQLDTTPLQLRVRALKHSLGYGPVDEIGPASASERPGGRTVLTAGIDSATSDALRRAGYTVVPIVFSPFDADAAAKVPHFETYNRTEAGQRVADIVEAVRVHGNTAIVARGDAALAAMLASAVVPVRVAVLDVGALDLSNDGTILDHAYIPGLQRAGGFRTAAEAAGTRLVIHDAGSHSLGSVAVRSGAMAPPEIVRTLRSAMQ